MKNTYNLLKLLLVIFIFNTSCENDGGDSVISYTNAAMSDFTVVEGSDAFIDLTSFNTLELKFIVDAAQGNPVSTDVKAFYQTIDGNLFGPVTIESGITMLPKEVALGGDTILNLFSELTSVNDVQVGDNLKIFTSFTFEDGTVIDLLDENALPNYFAPNFNAFTIINVKLDYVVSCPSSIEGTYDVLSSGFSTDGAPVNNPIENYAYTVTLTNNGGGNYTISDGVAGIYQDWYCAPYGYCFETAGAFTDVCGTLGGSWTESFGCQIDLTGVVNLDGTLTIQWINCFGDEITEAIYTPR